MVITENVNHPCVYTNVHLQLLDGVKTHCIQHLLLVRGLFSLSWLSCHFFPLKVGVRILLAMGFFQVIPVT